MLHAISRPLSCALFALCALAACSDTDRTSSFGSSEGTREFSAEDVQAAQALSISNRQEVNAIDDPYSRALLCRHGMAVLAGSLRNAAGLSQQQQDGIQQASAYFDNQLRELAGEEGKSEQDVVSDLEKTAEDNLDLSTNARTAIACLENLRNQG